MTYTSLKENKLENEIEQYLNKFVNYIKNIDIEDEEIVFIISSVTNSLVTSLFEIELNQEEILLVKELLKIYQNLLNQSLSQDDKSFLLITLSYLSLSFKRTAFSNSAVKKLVNWTDT